MYTVIINTLQQNVKKTTKIISTPNCSNIDNENHFMLLEKTVKIAKKTIFVYFEK